MDEKKNLSPEEKLLSVIQGKENETHGAAAKGAQKQQPKAPPAPAPAAARPAGDSLKFATTAQPLSHANPSPAPGHASSPATAPAPAATPAPVPAQPAGAVAGGAQKAVSSPARANLKTPSANRLDARSRTLATVNRLLRIAVAAMVGLCSWEIWANCSTDATPGKFAVGANTRAMTAPAGASAPCSSVLASFGGKSPFTPVEEVVEPPVTNVEKKTTISEVQQYVSKNLNLIGVSPGRDGTIQEAILTDAQTKKNYFLKVGEKIRMKNWDIELKQIAADRAVFLCGKEDILVQ